MRLSILSIATLSMALFATAASAAVIPQRVPRNVAPSTPTICSDSLGMLRAVHKDDVMDVDFSNTVVIRPVCLDEHLSGNASGLRGIIRENDAMSSALAEEGFASTDVVGIQFGGNGAVLLYVAY